jgi:hypothetical protein
MGVHDGPEYAPLKNISLRQSRDDSENERLTLRAKNANSFVTALDGTVYAPIGGGVVAAGYNVQAVMNTDRQRSTLKSLEEHLQSQLVNIKEQLAQHGYSGENEIEASLEITDNQYVAIFSKYGVSVTLINGASVNRAAPDRTKGNVF